VIPETSKNSIPGGQMLWRQFELVIKMWDSEMNRFWTRFHICTGFQFAAMVAFVSGACLLTMNQSVFRWLLVLIVLISALVSLITWRGFICQKLTVYKLRQMVNRLTNNASLSINVFEKSRFPPYLNPMFGMVISFVLTAFWIAALCYLEFINYKLEFPALE